MDFLGEEGRRARNASVRVSVYKKIKPWQLYNRSEAIGRIRDCYPKDVVNVDLDNVFEVGLDITTLGYDISDIINSLVRLDEKGSDSWVRKCGEEEQEIIQKQRRGVKAEYNDVRENLQLFEHGTGTVIQNHFVLTCRHVVETAIFNEELHVICISNAQLEEELFCKVIYDDVAKDLALLHCPQLNGNAIGPLQLSHEAQKDGFEVFCFGYPNNYYGKTALTVKGLISGSDQERYGRPPLMVLCCEGLNHGFSGSPVVLLRNSAVDMIGIVKEKQIKCMLTTEEQTFLGRVYEKYNLEGNVDSLTSKDVLSKLEQIEQKLNELEMSFPSGLGNAITGAIVQEFLNEASGTYKRWDCEELKKLTVIN